MELKNNKPLHEETIKYFTKKYANSQYSNNEKEYNESWDLVMAIITNLIIKY